MKSKSVREVKTTKPKKKISSRKLVTKALTKSVRDIIENTYQVNGTVPGWIMRNSNQPRIIRGKPVYIDKNSIGSADMIAMLAGGIVLWIELKVSPDKLRESQIHFAGECIKRDITYLVCKDNTAELETWIVGHGYATKTPIDAF